MIGHQSIIDLRFNGYKPTEIWVMLLDKLPRFGTMDHPEIMMQNQLRPEVHVLPDEVVETLDFRFVKEVTVHIVSLDKNRSIRALHRIAEFDPTRAICAGEDWMIGWNKSRGFINFFEKETAKDDSHNHAG